MTPFDKQSDRQFWKTGVGQATPDSISGVYSPKFPIAGLRIATAGSCFAQEIAKALKKRQFDVLDVEPAPLGTHAKTAAEFGYGQYSARHGNIYTSRHLVQLTEEALGLRSIPADILVWERNGRYFDSMRPTVEPNGLPTPDLVLLHRQDHLRRFHCLLEQCDLFVFTLGLTEAWAHRESGIFYQSTPGVIAGDYDPEVHQFRNMKYPEILEDMLRFRSLAHSVNPRMKFLLTVSPVPLTATYERRHVLVSTVRSKSILRAAAAELSETYSDIDYFPSYELLSTAFLGPGLFQENRRNVAPEGVAAVMNAFFAAHEPAPVLNKARAGEKVVKLPSRAAAFSDDADVACEDALLEGFAPR
jgi:hypothetical protein